MKTKKWISLLLVLVLTLGAGAAMAEQVFSLASASLGGTYYVVGSGLAELLTQKVDDLTVNCIISQGSTANAIKVGTKEVELAITNYYSGMRAIQGIAPYEQKFDFAGICTLQYSIIQFSTLTKSGIKTMQDLKGKNVAIGPAGGGGALIFEEILPYWGLKMDDMTISFVSYNDGADAMKDGRLEVNVPHGAPPLEAISTIAVTDAVTIVPMEPEILDQIEADLPYYGRAIVPAGSYNGIDEDVLSLGVQDILACTADMDEELVYQITKAIYENLEYLGEVHPSLKVMTFEGYKDSLVPLHAGARRFYEEKGIALE